MSYLNAVGEMLLSVTKTGWRIANVSIDARLSCKRRIRRTARAAFSALLISTVFVATPARAIDPNLPSAFSIETVISGLSQPVAFDFASGNRIFVARKGGRVDVAINGQLRSTPFIDISDMVNSNSDRGLLGLAVHPQFPSEPYVYLLFTYDPPESESSSGSAGRDGNGNRVSRLIRVTADSSAGYNRARSGYDILLGTNSTWNNIGAPWGDFASTPSCEYSSGNYVNDCLPIDESSHTIGDVRFAPDGSLLVSNGDGASFHTTERTALRAQDLDSLAGKILRIDPDTGDGLSDNPWYNGDRGSNRSKVLSYGLRNPFRFTLYPGTSTPVIGDVGWRNWEEINRGKGKNFGWPCYEGSNGVNSKMQNYESYSTCSDLYSEGYTVAPSLYSYNHNGQSASVQVGDFYTGSAWPSNYRGALFYSDINRGVIDYLSFDSSGNVVSNRRFASNAQGITQMRRGPDGDLYLADIYGGKIQAIRYSSSNAPPVARLTADRTSGEVPLRVRFDATGSSDPDGDTLSYRINYGNGQSVNQSAGTATYNSPGNYVAKLSVTDSAGSTRTDEIAISVDNNPPVARVNGDLDSRRWRPGERIQLSGSAYDPDESSISSSRVSWNAKLHHAEHIHPDHFAASGYTASFDYPDHGDDTWVEVCFRVEDSGGLDDEDCIELRPREVLYRLTTEPSGRSVSFGGLTGVSPMLVTTVVGGERDLSVSAIEPDGAEFESWSNGGAVSHRVVVGNTNQTLNANFTLETDVDGDGLNALEEAIWGGNPLVHEDDSDRDGTVDIIDSAPYDAADTGRMQMLTTNTWHRVYAGHRFAGSRYYSLVRLAFENPGSDVLLYMRGFDIDTGTEAWLWFSKDGRNWQRIRSLRPGPDNRLTGITKLIMSQSRMGPGRNYFEIRSSTPGDRWGVEKMLLKPIGAQPPVFLEHNQPLGRVGALDENDPNRYVVRIAFDGHDKDMAILYRGVEMERNGELQVLLNGRSLGATQSAGTRGMTPRYAIRIPKRVLKDTDNLLEFVTRFPGEPWALGTLRIVPLQSISP